MYRDLFDTEIEVDQQVIVFRSKEDPVARATRRIKGILQAGHPAFFAFSSGKDSSTLVAIGLNACRELINEGHTCPPVYVSHCDTGVESVEVSLLGRSEIAKMQAYAEKYGIPLHIRINKPQLAASFPVRVIGGRALPAFPDSRGDCSIDWKVLPSERAMREVFATLSKTGTWKAPVVLTGVRNGESIARDQRVAKRGEVAEGIWTNDFGDLRLSPLLDFSVDDIWEFIGLVNAGEIEAYSDFAEVMRIYRASGGDSCVIVADMKSAAHAKPCGTRTGCWVCTRVAEDKSMANMIESDPGRYKRLQPLAELRDFISNTQYDWSRRQYIGRSIDDEGYIAIGADTYSPDMLASLLRYTLTAQVLSGVDIISIEQLVAIDARWSQYALHPPFTALKIWHEVMDGQLARAPKVKRFPKTEVPKIGKVHVGSPTFRSAMKGSVAGLRNIGVEIFHESCGYELRELKDGTIVADMESEAEFTVDADGAADFIFFESERMIESYCNPQCTDWTWGYKTYLQYGTLSLAKGTSTQSNEIVQRSQWRQANDLHGQHSREELEQRCDVLFTAQLELI